MNYKRIYTELIERGKHRNKSEEVSYERHHIIPKCIGGNNKKENLVNLTLREHFICHTLLVKLYPNSVGLHFAHFMMGKRGEKHSRFYEHSKLKVIEYLKTREITEEWRKKISDTLTGRKLSKDHCDNIRAYICSMPQSHKDAISKGQLGRVHSDEHKRKIGASNKGKIRTKEFRKRLSENLKSKIASGEFVPNTSGLKNGHVPGEFVHSNESKIKMSNSRKGRSYEDLYGIDEAEIQRNKKRKQTSGENNPFFKSYDHTLALKLVLDGFENKEASILLSVSIPTHIRKFKEKYNQTPNEYKKTYEKSLHD